MVWTTGNSANPASACGVRQRKSAPVNRLCNVAQSARSRRETYIARGFPEPVDTSSAPLGSRTGRGAGVRGLVTTRETLSYETSSVCFPGSVRLPLPTDRRSPATRRSEHPPIGGLSSSSYCVRFTLLDRCHAHVDRNKWTVIGTDRARWCVVAVATIDASAEGINQILWMMRPSKLTAISKPEQTNGGVSAMTG